MTLKLPLIGAPRPLTSGADDLRLDGERVAPRVPVIAVAAARYEARRAAEEQVLALVGAAAKRGASAEVLVAGVESSADFKGAGASIVRRLSSAPEILEALGIARSGRPAALLDSRESSEPHAPRLIVSLGLLVPALVEPTFSVLIDGGVPPLAYDSFARTARHLFDARVSNAPEGWADLIAGAVLSNSGAEP